MMDIDCQKDILRIVNKAKDEVERKSRVWTGTWHRSSFDNNCLNTSIAIFCYGDCIVHGFVYLDMFHEEVRAYDANMSLLRTWEITNV